MSEVKTDSVVNVSGDNDSGIDLSTNDVVAIKTADTERVRVASDGKVGIGDTTPDDTLTIYGGTAKLRVGSTDSNHVRIGRNTTTGNFEMMRTTSGATDQVFFKAAEANNGAVIMQEGGGNVGIGTTNPSILFEVAGDVNANYIGSFHNDGNDANRYVLRLAGGSDSGSGTSYLVGLQDGDFNSVGSITHSGGNASFNTSSDYRLKENIVDMTGAIERVKSLVPKRFNFIRNPDITVDGFIAHEAQAVVPGAVSGTHNEVDDDNNPVYQGIDHSKLVPLLVGALKESITKIEALETEMTALKARVTALEDA